ncbi:helicase associated domain-containing protein [Streptomyces sp. NPDC052000]|uniref:helicase associated domain-containing protein n=1 Tax=Streptomyces sp. NPDC052000 TaxID=3155676 RepID=UPI00344B5FC9
MPRTHTEQITIEGDTTPAVVKLGVWISNTKTRRTKLTPEQRTQLAELGMEWA